MKKILAIYQAPSPNWVGDGFFVKSLFSYTKNHEQLSPFLLFDYAAPTEFAPADKPRGIGEHPHRGFETVTIVYQGAVAHCDSTGQAGLIQAGDVQWMTAGAGILHEEFHSPAFTQTGGTLEMVQLWVNLPAQYKLTTPNYQAIRSESIPSVELPNSAGCVRVIAGEYVGHIGPAKTFSPLQVWDIRLTKGSLIQLTLPEGWNTLLAILHGSVILHNDVIAHASEVVVLDRFGQTVVIKAQEDATLLLLSGEPLNEPVVGYGPFVMNSSEEIKQAITDFRSGQF